MEPTICRDCCHRLYVRMGDDVCTASPYGGTFTVNYVSGWRSPVEDGYRWSGGDKWFAYCKNVNTNGCCPKYEPKASNVQTTEPEEPKKPWWKLW